MARRDQRERRGGRGARAGRRTRAPDLLQSEESEPDELDGGLLSGIPRRARHQYDERVGDDDMAGVEAVRYRNHQNFIQETQLLFQEMPLEQLHDIKANSVAEWIAIDRVRQSIARHFRQFLISYTDEQGNSVHYPRIRNLGESMLSVARVCPNN